MRDQDDVQSHPRILRGCVGDGRGLRPLLTPRRGLFPGAGPKAGDCGFSGSKMEDEEMISRPYFFYPFGGERVTRASKRAIMRAAHDAVKGHPGKWVNVYTPAGRFLACVVASKD